jgi:hypothetical protein
MTRRTPGSILCAALAVTMIAGCQAKPDRAAPPAATAARRDDEPQRFIPYTPATQPEQPITAPLPENPRDARPAIELLYAVEIWEVDLPRDSVTTDEAFWKRVDEQSVDLPTYDQLYKNGIRVGQLPMTELSEISKLIDQRKGKRTQIQGMEGKQITIPIRSEIPRQVLFYLDRSNRLVGRSYDRSENFFGFSFESTPRNPDRIRLALTPTVRALDKKIVYTATPGKDDRDVRTIVEESHYDTNLRTDLSLSNALVIAPSVEARYETTLGHAFLIQQTPSEELERLIVIIPRAFKRDAAATAAR